MRTYTEAELLLCALSMLPETSGHTEKTLGRRLLKYGAVPANGEITLETLKPFLRSGEQESRVAFLLTQKQAVLQKITFLAEKHIIVLTRLSPEYPERILTVMGDRAPLVLFCMGNLSLFEKRCISLVGSRKLDEAGRAFALEAGRQIAAQGYVYCSGGAVGADSAGYEGAIPQGEAILYLPDSLEERAASAQYRADLAAGKLLLVSEDGSDFPFTTPRALSRNHLIHAMGLKTLVAQTDIGKGGTWNGTEDNLKHHYSPVFVCSDHADPAGMNALVAIGASPASASELSDLDALTQAQLSMDRLS